MSPSPLLTAAEFAAATGAGVRVLVADSGVEVNHPDLAGAAIDCYALTAGANGSAKVESESPLDVFGHGTAVAAIIHQFAPDAKIDSLRVLGGDLRASSLHALVGLEWAIREGYDVINCSFGSASEKYLLDYKRLVDLAFCGNSLLIAACNNQSFCQPDYPSSFPTVISTDYGKLEPAEIRRRPGYLVEFVARGSAIQIAWKGGQHRTSTGSSYAAPHLAALVARIRQCRAKWNACQVKAALYRLAEGRQRRRN